MNTPKTAWVGPVNSPNPLWSGTNKNRDISTGPLARPFPRSLAPLTRLLARSLHSLPRSWESEFLMSQNDLVLSHSASPGWQKEATLKWPFWPVSLDSNRQMDGQMDRHTDGRTDLLFEKRGRIKNGLKNRGERPGNWFCRPTS